MPEPESLRVAAAAYEFERCTSLDALGRRIGDWVGRGARTGARLLVLPEYGAMEAADAVGAVTGLDLAASLRAVAEAMPALSWPRCCSACNPSAVSGPRARGWSSVAVARFSAAAARAEESTSQTYGVRLGLCMGLRGGGERSPERMDRPQEVCA